MLSIDGKPLGELVSDKQAGQTPILLRFADLKARGIVQNWPTLLRWIACENFPPGKMLGPNTRAWTDAEVAAWLESRPAPHNANTAA
jgi:hypothetical protein